METGEDQNQVENKENASKRQISDSAKILELYASLKKTDSSQANGADEATGLETKKIKSDENEDENKHLINDLIFQDLQNTKLSEVKKTENLFVIEAKKDEEIKNEENRSFDLKNTNRHLSPVEGDLVKSASNNSNLSIITLESSKSDQNRASKMSDVEVLPEWLKENVHVVVSTNSVMNKPGFVRYIGPTKFAPGTWVGVELEQAFGKNDGSYKGVRYFKCAENRGVFVRADKLSLVK